MTGQKKCCVWQMNIRWRPWLPLGNKEDLPLTLQEREFPSGRKAVEEVRVDSKRDRLMVNESANAIGPGSSPGPFFITVHGTGEDHRTRLFVALPGPR